MSPSYSAPGKLMILGEYGVVDGGRAMVAAVDRRAVGKLAEAAPPPTPVIAAVLRVAEGSGFPRIGAGISVDTRSMIDHRGQKLGIGSSAAAALVAAALATGTDDETALEIAIRGHRLAAGGLGSGVDVAASFTGGVIASATQPSVITPLPSALRGLTLSVLYTGEPASSSELVARAQAAPRWKEHARALSALAEEGIDAWSKQDATRFLSVVARSGRAMDSLGRDAGTPIVTPQIAEIMRLAGEAEGAAKPSGAGGGDVVVLFVRDRTISESIAQKTGATLVELEIDRVGLRREAQRR
jgi:phosphomevalonate kinase